MNGPSSTARGLGVEWRRLAKRARTVYPNVCHVCGGPINLTLPPGDPMSWTCDHLDARSRYGNKVPDITRVRPAHRSCNSRRGAGPKEPKRWAL